MDVYKYTEKGLTSVCQTITSVFFRGEEISRWMGNRTGEVGWGNFHILLGKLLSCLHLSNNEVFLYHQYNIKTARKAT